MGGMRNSYDDLGVVAELLYGHVLSNTEVIGKRDTSFCLIAGLIPQDVRRKLALPDGIFVKSQQANRC